MSSDLQWMLLRNTSSFLVKRNGVQFSSEPSNLMNLNSYKFSGLANKKTVGVVVVPREELVKPSQGSSAKTKKTVSVVALHTSRFVAWKCSI